MAFPVVRVCVAVGSLVRGQRLLLLFDACAVTYGRSFTMLSVWGDLISFWSVLVFSPTLLSLLFLLPSSYCCCCCYFYWLLLLSLFPQSFWLCVTGAWAGAGYRYAGGACGWLRVGQAFEVLLLPGLGSAVPAPRFLGTQPPRAMQALINVALRSK